MAGAYAGIANMGKFNKPTPIIKILDRNGKVLYEHKTNPTQAVKPESAYMMISMMEDVMTRGTGRGAAISRPCAGKSGTTDNYHDAWFVGFTPNLACAVWIGDDNNESLGGMTGGGQPATRIAMRFYNLHNFLQNSVDRIIFLGIISNIVLKCDGIGKLIICQKIAVSVINIASCS